MSRTFKDTPLWVRIRRAHSTTEVHIGCPHADKPRWRQTRQETVSEPYWHLETVHYRYDYDLHREVVVTNPHLFYLAKARTQWVFSRTIDTIWMREPYQVDVCDLDLRGGNMYRRCHYEADWHDPAVNQDFRGRRMQVYDRAERSRTRVTLAAARRDWNSNGDTDLEPAHEPADPWWWD